MDAAGDLPEKDAANEYAELFKKAFPDPSDRRKFVAECMKDATPSLGPLAIAALLRGGVSRVAWTTNFDAVIEDAFAKIFQKTSDLTVVSIDNANVAPTAIVQEQWPVLVKLHGDFRSVELKNTSEELQEQDQRLRQALLSHLGSNGLIVAGYSGRDASVMETLESALSSETPFPGGFFWFTRRGVEPFGPVVELVRNARDRGVDSALIEIENFDEAMLDIVETIGEADKDILKQVRSVAAPSTTAPYLSGSDNYPLVRLNALMIERFPSEILLVDCSIGGFREVQEAIEEAGLDIVATRSKHGVLALGSRAELTKVFASFDIKDISMKKIEEHRLRFDSAERGLLRQALGLALERSLQLTRYRRRVADLFRPSDPASPQWGDLRSSSGGPLSGIVPKSDLTWFEGLEVRLDWADDAMWLLFESRIVFEGINAENKAAAADFAREKTARRYNAETDRQMSYWAKLLWQEGNPFNVLLNNQSDGPSFELSKRTAYSWRHAA
ncbi:SIR2 family NAD-dependent protein deacylase [Pelagerythrobacter aerophilus]